MIRTLLVVFAFVPLAGASELVTIDQGRGPVPVWVPDDAADSRGLALILQLHGRGSTGERVERYLRFVPHVDELEFIYVVPDGAIDSDGLHYWNATPACCDFYDSGIDDSGYLRALIDEVMATYPVHPARVFVIGHSNGGFMAYRMACDHAGVVTGVVSIAGASFLDPQDCQPAAPVHVVQVHGTADGGLLYDGGCFYINYHSYCYPSAVEMTQQWATYNECDLDSAVSLPPLDLSTIIAGAETSVLSYRNGCRPGGSVELWSVEDGMHSPIIFSADFVPTVIGHLYALTPPMVPPRRASGRIAP